MAFNFFQKFSQKKRLPTASIGKRNDDAAANTTTEKVVIKRRPTEKNIFASKYIISPHISEKASLVQETSNKNTGVSYVFRVTGVATKHLLKKAVEDRYDVKVDSVRIINTPNKEIRRGKIIGHKSGYKKAIITLRPGNTIEQL